MAEPPDLDPEIRGLLARARGGMSPTGADEARVLTRVRGVLAHEPFLVRRAWILRAQGAALGLGLGLAVGVGLGGMRGEDGLAEPGDARHLQSSAKPAPASASDASTELLPTWADREPTEESRLERTAPRAEERGRRPAGAKLGRADRTQETPALAEERLPPDEVRMVKEAQRALVMGNAALALETLNRLDRELPSGRLLEERKAARAIASCMLQPSQRSRILEQFLSEVSESVHEARVRRSCQP